MSKQIVFVVVLCFPFCSWSQCSEDVNVWAESWTSCQKSPNPNPNHNDSHWILYEFDEAIEIIGTHIWNANNTNESVRGIQEAIIEVSYDGSSWLPISISSFQWLQAPESTNYLGFAGPPLNEHGLITKVLITILSTHGIGDCASIAELRFDVNPDACDGLIDECDVCNGPGQYTYYLDADGDGLGNQSMSLQACKIPDSGYVTNNDDECDTGGWTQMGLLFDTNGCTGCHNSTSPSGLNLLTYDGFLVGGNKCGDNLLTGSTLVNIITIEGYSECGPPIQGLSMNDRVGGLVDDFELAQIQAWINAGAPESDCIICDNVPGSSCDDGDICTVDDINTIICTCAGRFEDIDNDGVCDVFDACQGGDDSVDSDGDGTPDFCDDCDVISSEDFESANSSFWTMGGIDAEIVASAYSPSGDYSIRIRDNSFEMSSINSAVLDFSDMDSIQIHFDFQAIDMEIDEDFFLEISVDGGINYTIYKEWNSGAEFVNDTVYHEDIVISNENLSGSTLIRFRCDGTINSDEVYLDNIIIETCETPCFDHIMNVDNSELLFSSRAVFDISSNNVVPTSANVELSAGDYISLTEGFEVRSGAVFHAYIKACE